MNKICINRIYSAETAIRLLVIACVFINTGVMSAARTQILAQQKIEQVEQKSNQVRKKVQKIQKKIIAHKKAHKKAVKRDSLAYRIKKYGKRLCRLLPETRTVMGVGAAALAACLLSTDESGKAHGALGAQNNNQDNKKSMSEEEYWNSLTEKQWSELTVGRREQLVKDYLRRCGIVRHANGVMLDEFWITQAAQKSKTECERDIFLYAVYKVAQEAETRGLSIQRLQQGPKQESGASVPDEHADNRVDNKDEDSKEAHCNIVTQQRDSLIQMCHDNPWLGHAALLRSRKQRERLLDYVRCNRLTREGTVFDPAIRVLTCGDLVAQPFDSSKRIMIVSAANKHMNYVNMAGVARAIGDVAGAHELEANLKEQLRQAGKESVNPGEVMVSDSFGLRDRGVSLIAHAVAPDCRINQEKANGPVLLKQAYENTIKAAIKEKVDILYLTSLGTAVFGYPIEEATPIALSTVNEQLASYRAFRDNEPDSCCLEKVVFVAYTPRSYETYKRHAEALNISLILDGPEEQIDFRGNRGK